MVLSFLVSCSREKPAEVSMQKPSEATDSGVIGTSVSPAALSGQYSLEITPSEADLNATLRLLPKGFALNDAKIEWVVNGQVVSSPNPSVFRPSDIRKGSNIKAKAIVQGKEVLSNVVNIVNTPPEMSKIKIMPEVFKLGDSLYIDASGSDADGDAVSISYEWSKNGEPAGTERQIGMLIKRGDRIDVKITPFDGEKYGKTVILHREIKNMPPVIIEHNKFNFDGKVYTYQVNAADSDGDQLAYSLKTAPSGMTINPASGLIIWNVPADFKGAASTVISVTDGHGGEASYALSVTMR